MKGPFAPEPRHPTLLAALASAAQSAHGVTFVGIGDREERQSWAVVERSARTFAAALQARGVLPGDRVALLLRTGPSFLHAFYGALLAGAVPVPLYPPVRLGRLEDYHRATAAMITKVAAAVVVSEPPLSRLLGPTLEAARPKLGLALVAELGAEGNGTPSAHTPDVDDLALIQFSSGSTVDPKPVCLTHRHLQAHVAALQAVVEARDGDGFVSWLPLYHDMGLIGAVLSTLDYPGPLVLIPPELFLARPSLWLRALSRHRATISGAPNFAYGLCLKRVKDSELEGVDLSAWRLAFNGAEAVSAEGARAFCERFARFGFRSDALRPVYGLSEATLAVTFPPARAALTTAVVAGRALAERGELEPAVKDAPGARELVSLGSPVPGLELEIRGDQGRALPAGRVGRVLVRGPSVMRGYFDDAEATAKVLVDGWLDTGDLGLERDGELFLVGRAKDVIILRGANHPPRAFEECLDALPGLRVGCAVALGFVPPGAEGEELLVLAEWAEELEPAAREALLATVRDAILARTGIRAHTVELLAPGTLPRTSSGKLRRAEALRRYQAGELKPPDPVNAWRLGKAMARSAVAFAKLRFDARGARRRPGRRGD